MKKIDIMNYLSVGEENAVKCSELAKILGWSEREVTIAINTLRKQGELICSSTHSGFWLPADEGDIKYFVRMMNSRISDMKKALKPAEEYLENINENT